MTEIMIRPFAYSSATCHAKRTLSTQALFVTCLLEAACSNNREVFYDR